MKKILNLDDKFDKWAVKVRQYQLDMYHAARKRNIIAFLDTGSGKTFISVLLIREMAGIERNKDLNERKRVIFFLVPKRVLVAQQAYVLRKYTDLHVLIVILIFINLKIGE